MPVNASPRPCRQGKRPCIFRGTQTAKVRKTINKPAPVGKVSSDNPVDKRIVHGKSLILP